LSPIHYFVFLGFLGFIVDTTRFTFSPGCAFDLTITVFFLGGISVYTFFNFPFPHFGHVIPALRPDPERTSVEPPIVP
jgi:hypothetical protein